MSREDLIKKAYIYGVGIALGEAGFEKEAASELAIRLTEEQMEPPRAPEGEKHAEYDAYIEGASVALVNAGMEKRAAVETAKQMLQVKLAEEPTTSDRVLTGLFGPIGAAATAPEGKGWKTFGHTYGKGLVGGLGGGALGGGAGAGIGALAALLSRGKIDPRTAAGIGGTIGGYGGLIGGQQIGLQKGLTSGYAD